MKSYIIDIDGTILDGSSELNNSKQFLQFLQETGSEFLLATNSIKSHDLQVERFKAIGITVSAGKIYTPIDSINKYIERNSINNVFVVGAESEISQIHANHSLSMPELIILLDFEKSNFSYNNLQTVIDYIEDGARIITASKSSYYLKYDKKQIDTGAFVTLIESVTGLSIPVLGKPSKDYFLNAQSILNSSKDQTVVIGDDWKTDILGAEDVGFNSILVKSGKYKECDEDNCNPGSVINNLTELMR